MNGVIYARYSSHNQREESIEGQVRKCRQFAEQHNITIVGEYLDRAISGKTDKREQFQRLIRDSDKGKFEAVIMYTLDRFARNRYDSAHYKAKLKKNGVRLFYTEQTITDEPEGIILESVLEGMAEYYSENLSRGVKRGMHENALQCKSTGGYMPLGYLKTKDKKFEIDPATAPIVREIFDLYANGTSQRKLVDILNEKGYRTLKQKQFTLNGIQNILKNQKYVGRYIFDDIIIENGIPAIVDSETFEKVQSMLVKNKRVTGKMTNPARYLLTTKLFCGECGSPMVGESGTSKTGAIYNYYKCSDRKKRQSCHKANERKEWIERLVVEKVIANCLQDDAIDEIAENVSRIAEKERLDKSRLLSLQSDLKDVQTKINRILDLVEQGISTDDVTSRLLDLNALKSDITKQIDIEEIKKPLISKDRIAFWLTDLLSNGYVDDPNYQQRIIDTLVNKVFVFDTDGGGRKIVIICNTSQHKEITVSLNDVRPYVNGSAWGSDSDLNGRPKNNRHFDTTE